MTATIVAGTGIRQLRVVIPCRSSPITSRTSASAISFATKGSCGGATTVPRVTGEHPARLVRGDHERAEALGQPAYAGLRGDGASPEPHHDTTSAQRLGGRGDGVGGRPHAGRRQGPRHVRRPRCREHVGRDPEVRRTSGRERLRHQLGQRGDGLLGRPRRHRPRAEAAADHLGLAAHPVQQTVVVTGGAARRERRLARDEEDGGVRRPGLAERGERVGEPGAGGGERDAETAGGAGRGVGGVTGGLLVPHADDARAAPDAGPDPERQVVHARDAEAHADAVVGELVEDRVADGRGHGPVLPPCVAPVGPRGQDAGRADAEPQPGRPLRRRHHPGPRDGGRHRRGGAARLRRSAGVVATSRRRPAVASSPRSGASSRRTRRCSPRS